MTTEDALKAAMLSGIQNAYELLAEEMPNVAKENQTWESAIARLTMFKVSVEQALYK